MQGKQWLFSGEDAHLKADVAYRQRGALQVRRRSAPLRRSGSRGFAGTSLGRRVSGLRRRRLPKPRRHCPENGFPKGYILADIGPESDIPGTFCHVVLSSFAWYMAHINAERGDIGCAPTIKFVAATPAPAFRGDASVSFLCVSSFR